MAPDGAGLTSPDDGTRPTEPASAAARAAMLGLTGVVPTVHLVAVGEERSDVRAAVAVDRMRRGFYHTGEAAWELAIRLLRGGEI